MRLHFTKMQGAGNDFVVIDATRAPVELAAAQLRALGDRRTGVGADQILLIEPGRTPGIDFNYRIFNGGSGDEVEQCGNGARCLARFALDKGLTDRHAIKVATMNSVAELHALADGRVSVDMGAPIFEPARVPFDANGLVPAASEGSKAGPRIADGAVGFALWPLDVDGTTVDVGVVSMGNPHAVQLVADVDLAPVASQGPLIEAHARFPRRVNAGFMQVVSRSRIRLRVYERGAGETLACGTGACAAVVVGIRRGLLDRSVDVEARGGMLTIEWPNDDASVWMTGPAATVFEGEIDV